MIDKTPEITELILKAAAKARKETSSEPEPGLTKKMAWPVDCTVGPGLEGAFACESKIGYVNGTKGWLIYRGYDIFDLCAYSTFEEVSYLLLHGKMPTEKQLANFKRKLVQYRHMPQTLRRCMSFPLENMNTMAALRLCTNMMRQEFTTADLEGGPERTRQVIESDADSIPMETPPTGEEKAIYEFQHKRRPKSDLQKPTGLEACDHLIAGVATITAAIARVRQHQMPIEPDPELSHAANFLYMITGKRPSAVEERIMDVALILHADHGMNASTFASMVVASTLSDIYLSIGSGIAALNGPLHGGANAEVLKLLNQIGSADKVDAWYKKARAKKQKIMGFGHRVYKAYDPRARILGPLAKLVAKNNKKVQPLLKIANKLERNVISTLGKDKGIFPNVDFYSGLVYASMGIPSELFTPTFAVSRVSGWSARVLEYLENNRIFRPRAMYTGSFNKEYVPIEDRKKSKK
jgi:citrate synthase